MNEVAVTKIFASIEDKEDPNTASMEGIWKLYEDLGIDAVEDIRILVLLWQLGANDKPAQINIDT